MAKKLAGKKYSDKHSTVIDGAYDVAKLLENDEAVYKIVLGIIRQSNASTDARLVKIIDIAAGIEIIIKSKRYVQTIYAYIREPELNRQRIKEIISK